MTRGRIHLFCLFISLFVVYFYLIDGMVGLEKAEADIAAESESINRIAGAPALISNPA